jgi:heat shock protein HslJ
MKRTFPIFALIVLVVLIVVGCAPTAQPTPADKATAAPTNPPSATETPAVDPEAQNPQRLLIPRWFLELMTLDGTVVPVPADQQQVTIAFTPDGKVDGNGGCNSFGGEYQLGENGGVKFGPLASTMMACDNTMQLESTYFQALAKVESFQVSQGKLTLSSADGKTVLVYHMPPK